MDKEIIVNSENLEARIAVREDGLLMELYIERPWHSRVVGNIYRGRVQNVLPGMQAAFVNIGLERNAFLYVDDITGRPSSLDDHSPDEVKQTNPKKELQIKDLLTPGQEITVQISKEPIGTKGARVVTELSIAGRYLVLVADGDYVGVSRRIESEQERERLRELGQKIRPKGKGLIIRTAAEGQNEEVLRRDLTFLTRVWQRLKKKEKQVRAPALLYKDHDLIYRVLRDQLDDDVDKIVVDQKELYDQVRETLKVLSPNLLDRVELYHGPEPIFTYYGIETEIEKALKRRVWLNCGGYLVIDQAEALTVIDVNTGKFVGSTDLATTVRTTNLEAAAEIARQLRLRNVTGIIIVDFIDMDNEADRQLVLDKLECELKRDRTKTNILEFTSLGLVQITRKKVHEVLGDILQRACPYCDGTGRVLSEETMAIRVERYLREFFATSPGTEAILLGVHPWVAAVLIGAGGANITRLEEELQKAIYVRGVEANHIEEIRIIQAGTRSEVETQALPVRLGQVMEVEIECAHLANPQNGISRLEGYIIDVEGAGTAVGSKLKVEITRVFRTYARARICNK